MPTLLREWMPPEAPLQRPIQRLNRPYRDVNAPAAWAPAGSCGWRLLTFGPALLLTLALVLAFWDWFAVDGLSGVEGVIIAIVSMTVLWISISVATSCAGILSLLFGRRRPAAEAEVRPLDVALLVPVYNEAPADVFGNAAAMLAGLERLASRHGYTLYILSDTRDDVVAAAELRAFLSLRTVPRRIAVHYRRRADNVDGKVGNLAEWVETWGGRHEAMLVLDADSLMSPRAVGQLTDALAGDPAAGLIQSFPMLFGAETLFGRIQQFSGRVYGLPLAEGLARWTGREGNYWGHNAIIRTAAFAASAGLPRVGARRGSAGRVILSHDFVEAGLLRRAGWAVRFLPRVEGSYEEPPPTLVDYILRDRRWCQGNLQHLALIATRGLHPVSRFHLLSGAMGYLLSPAWFTFLVIWAVTGPGREQTVLQYFSGFDPQVSWPETQAVNDVSILVFMYGLLLAPKLVAACTISRAGLVLRDLGGLPQFLVSLAVEIVLSVLYAPILMIAQTVAVLRSALGVKVAWTPQRRRGGRYGVATLAKFHWLETAIGLLLFAGMATGLVTLWLAPIALSLALATPLSALSGLDMARRRWARRQLGTPETLNAPPIIRRARVERRRIASLLAAPEPQRIAAE